VIEYEKSDGSRDEYEVASAPYSNGGFTLNLPKLLMIYTWKK
jgi:hypothetical protein